MTEPVIRTVTPENLNELGFFCYKSKPKSPGYQAKLAWLEDRLAEGMQIKILFDGNRSFAFIEYIPGEYAWRAVEASGYMFIHCLWVVGSGKGKGFATLLLDECIQDAREAGLKGVAMLTSTGNWLVDKPLFIKKGFERVGAAPPSFDLMAFKFETVDDPTLPSNWEERCKQFGKGFSVVYSAQCPYIADSVMAVHNAAAQLGEKVNAKELRTAKQVRDSSPSAYGLFSILFDGELLSYHPLGTKDILKRMEARA